MELLSCMKKLHRRNFNLPGHAHELTFSCYRGFPFLKAERTSQWLVEAIEHARMEHHFAVWACFHTQSCASRHLSTADGI
jgi:hypothetical protein